MARLFLIIALGFILILSGCNKSDEDVDAISQEALQDETTAVMDSLENATAGKTESETAAEQTDQQMGSRETSESKIVNDYSGLSGYVVQIGSYAKYSFAQMMAEKYIKRDYPAFVISADIDGIIYYRLRIGVYETIDEAKTIANLVEDRYSAEYWIDNN